MVRAARRPTELVEQNSPFGSAVLDLQETFLAYAFIEFMQRLADDSSLCWSTGFALWSLRLVSRPRHHGRRRRPRLRGGARFAARRAAVAGDGAQGRSEVRWERECPVR